MSMKPFERWLTQDVETTFGVKKVKNHPAMLAWMAAEPHLTQTEMERVEPLRLRLEEKVDFWNEDELKLFFLAELVNFIDFNRSEVYSTFSQRVVSATLKDVANQDVPLRGRVEWMVATGKQIPGQPFFFLHEYKPQLKTTPADPLGQLLIAMLTTQLLNESKERLMYGAFVLGRLWFFVLLDKKNYAVSKSFDLTDSTDFQKVIAILQECKKYIDVDVAKFAQS